MRTSHRRRSGALALLTVLAAGLIAGCSQPVAGKPTTALSKVDPNSVAGLPVTDHPDGPKRGVPDARLPVHGGAHTKADKIAVNALSDIFDYWNAQLPERFGQEFSKPVGYHSYDSRKHGPRLCGQPTKKLVNAFYCKTDRTVAWDRGRLLPQMIAKFGPNAVVAVLAHELGHSVQYQLGRKSGINHATPGIVAEQQADCYAGSFMRWAAKGKAKHFAVATGKGLNKIMSTLLFIGDMPGTSAKSAPDAHGSAFDRAHAFQTGFAGNPKRCAAIDKHDVDNRSTERMFNRQEAHQDKGDIEVRETLPLVKQNLDGAFEETGTPSPEATRGDGTCGSGNTPPVSYCAKPNKLNVALEDLQRIGEGVFGSGAVQNIAGKNLGGDFSAFAEFASRYTLAVQRHAGLRITGKAAGLRSGCLTGAWAKYASQRHGSGDQLRLAAGDLDEAITEMLQPHSVITDDVAGNGVRSGFARVQAFRIGYLKGSQQCSAKFG